MSKLKGVVLTVNYPDDTVEAAIPQEMSIGDLAMYLRVLMIKEPEATSFVLTAAIEHEAKLTRGGSIACPHCKLGYDPSVAEGHIASCSSRA